MLQYLSDFKNSIRYSVLERVSNPLFSAFVFSWVAFNWQIILVLFLSDKDIEIKIGAILSLGGWFKSFFLPALSATIYVTVMPHLVEHAYKFQSGPFKRSQDKLADRIDNALKRKSITEALRAEADIAYDRKKADEEKDIQQMKLDIANLRTENGDKEKEVDSLKAEIQQLQTDLINSQIEKENVELDFSRFKTEVSNRSGDLYMENQIRGYRESGATLTKALREIFIRHNLTPNEELRKHLERIDNLNINNKDI